MTFAELQKNLYAIFGHLTDKQLLAITIYGEARGESREGQIAVGSVILERVDHRGWDGDTIKEVCLMPWQFSCFLPSDPNAGDLAVIARNFAARYEKSSVFRTCFAIADLLIDGKLARTPEIAAHHVCQYCTTAVSPDWKKKMKLVAAVGRHEFYA